MLNFPSYLIEPLVNLERVQWQFQEAFNRTPTPEEIADKISLSLNRVHCLLEMLTLFKEATGRDPLMFATIDLSLINDPVLVEKVGNLTALFSALDSSTKSSRQKIRGWAG